MTAYAAAISLKNTIEHILHSCRICLVPPSPEVILLAYNELQPLQETLKRVDSTNKSKSRKRVNTLDVRIKDTLWEFEDRLESLLFDQITSQIEIPLPEQLMLRSEIYRRRLLLCKGQEEREEHRPSRLLLAVRSEINERLSHDDGVGERDVQLFSIDLQGLQNDVDSFIQTLNLMEEEYIHELENMPEDEEAVSSRIGFDGRESEMIGLSDEFEEVREVLLRRSDTAPIYALVGMAGIGKTTLAGEIFEDESISSHYECRAWITVGRMPRCNLSQVSRGILTQLCGITPGDDDEKLRERLDGKKCLIDLKEVSRGILAQLCGNARRDDEEETDENLKERLEGKKCLIVLDDVWETEVLAFLLGSLEGISGGILITLRDRNVFGAASVYGAGFYKPVRFLDDEESLELLSKKVFGEEELPDELKKAAKKIAKNCEGLPLTIVTVARILSESPHKRDPEYWDDVAEYRNSVFTDAYNEMSKILFPSYDYLPQDLKMFFLFMGVFPPDYYVPKSKIINMLSAEGWLYDLDTNLSLKHSVMACFLELCAWRYLLLFKLSSIFWFTEYCSHGYKSCRLHSSWRHLCRGEAWKNKFYHVLNRLDDALEDGTKGQRYLCLHNNILFSLQEFCNSVRSDCASTTRSLLFFGPYHQYPIPIGVVFKLLRELDALNLRFYTFPVEILALVQLKYLALTCNGELPTTISKLFNLRVLIIHQHMNIKHSRAPSYIPLEIWDMQELEHVEIMGKILVAPIHDAACLEKLSTLSGLNANICTISDLFKRIPCIKRLGIRSELTPNDEDIDLVNCLRCTSPLVLETLKCSITNPVIKYAFTPTLTWIWPRLLKKLHLSGMGFPWEYMASIGTLEFLEVLKLRCYAFRGPKWETQEDSFLRLEFLLIEDTDLVQWKPISGSFPMLSYLKMEHCYKLKELHWSSNSSPQRIELVDCNTSAHVIGWTNSSKKALIVHSSF